MLLLQVGGGAGGRVDNALKTRCLFTERKVRLKKGLRVKFRRKMLSFWNRKQVTRWDGTNILSLGV